MKKKNKAKNLKPLKVVGTGLMVLRVLFSIFALVLSVLAFGGIGYAVYKTVMVLKAFFGV